MAIGMIEVMGFSVALEAADAMCKAAQVKIEAFDANNPADASAKIPLVVQVKLSGGVSDIKTALEVGRRTALRTLKESEVITGCIASEDAGLGHLVTDGKLPPLLQKAVRTPEPEPSAPKRTKSRAAATTGA